MVKATQIPTLSNYPQNNVTIFQQDSMEIDAAVDETTAVDSPR